MKKEKPELKKFILRYIYKIVSGKGRKKNRFGSEVVELDSTPAELIRSKKLHNYLAERCKVPKGHTILSVQITEVTEVKKHEANDDSKKKGDRNSENESGKVREIEDKKS